MWVFTFALLVYYTQDSACGCLSHAYDYFLVMLKVFASYVFDVFAMKSYIALTHRVTFTVRKAPSRSWMIDHECFSCRLQCRSVMFNICIYMVWLFRRQVVRVCSYMITYASFNYSHTQSFLLKFWWPKYSLIARQSPCFRANRLSTITTQKHQASSLKLCFPQAF